MGTVLFFTLRSIVKHTCKTRAFFPHFSDVVISKTDSRSSSTTTARSLDDEDDDYDIDDDEDDEIMDIDDKDTINLNEVIIFSIITVSRVVVHEVHYRLE